jgi:hypothetical protein
MSRFLTTLPTNLGYYNLGTVESYPTGGTGPTAYGPTSYYGSDPLPAQPGDSINTPIDLGDFSNVFRSLTISNTHGGLSRKQSTFYKLRLLRPRAIQFTQNYSQFSLTSNTNKNTLLAFYVVENGTHRRELPINDQGYVYKETGIDYDSEDGINGDYPSQVLDPGNYIILITNDIRYLETTYSITLEAFLIDWRFVNEDIEESLDFRFVSEGAETLIDFGSIVTA